MFFDKLFSYCFLYQILLCFQYKQDEKFIRYRTVVIHFCFFFIGPGLPRGYLSQKRQRDTRYNRRTATQCFLESKNGRMQ